MRIVIGHANPDFDAYASMVAATRLFPGSVAVWFGSQNENVRAFHNLHGEFLPFAETPVDPARVDGIVMVDSQQPSRIDMYHEIAADGSVPVVIYDHHPPMEGRPAGADLRIRAVGATTSILVQELREANEELTPLEASVMLLGIHEDTGSLTFPSTTVLDVDAAAWLMAQGADLEVLNQFLGTTLDDSRRRLLEQFTSGLEVWDVHGQAVAVVTAVTEQYVDSAGVLAHHVVEDLGYPVAIAVVDMPGRLQVIGRSRLTDVDLNAVMRRLGGGGHPQAASAAFRDLDMADALVRLRAALEAEVASPPCAKEIMTSPVRFVGPESSMAEAAEVMATWGHGALAVMDEDALVGMVTRKDVDKALRHGLDHAPVTGFMNRTPLTIGPDASLTEMEALLAERGIGRLPVLDTGRLVGIVTRKDVLRAEYGEGYFGRHQAAVHDVQRRRFVESVDRLLPIEASHVLSTLGDLAEKRGLRAHVVGGFVRDMLLGRPNLDLDVVVEGDGIAFAEAAASLMGVRLKAHRRFGTAVLVLDKTLHVDVTSARTEYYTRPGSLPTVEFSTLRQDLLRRDFTINAMAACIDLSCAGEIADPFGGIADLETGTVRVLHSLSFVDDPTRVLRAARFEVRYGFSADEATEALARQAIALGLLGEVSGARVREEMYDILDEDDPAAVLARLHELGAADALAPEGVKAELLISRVSDARHASEELAARLRRPVIGRTLLVAAMCESPLGGATEHWLRHFRVARETAQAARDLAARGTATRSALADRRKMRDSRLYRLLEPYTPEALVLLWASGSDVARGRIERFLEVLAHVRPAVTGRDLEAMGIEPSEAYARVLAAARDDLLDGRSAGREAELANLRRIAASEGLLPAE